MMPTTVNMAGIAYDSVTDGPGIRLVLFVQGCDHRCPGCHNPSSWDFQGGTPYPVEDMYELINRYPYIDGVSFSGGEPFYQAEPLAVLGQKIRRKGYSIVTYSGFTFEEILDRAGSPKAWRDLLSTTDILIDGPFLLEKREPGLPFRGSANQRLIDVPRSLEAGRVILYQPKSGG